MWARSEYAGELAVLATWLCALLPWSVTLFSPQGLTALTFRFLPLRLLYILGTELPGERPLLFVWQVPGFVATPGETLAATAWLAGSAAFLVPLGLSVVYYLRDDRLERRFTPRLTFGLVAASAVLVLAAALAAGLSGDLLVLLAAATVAPLAAGLADHRLHRDEGRGRTYGDPVRALGLLLLVAGLALLVPLWQHWQATAGTTVPVGILFQLGLGAILVRIERV
ncbi:DUF7549 family protein [Salinirussus salinus]|uniref:DUF7549 family protein n=1 Tax=Salinirussus salinus TaxID=1198300 RepID=UPI0013581F22|nr:hypothetical protein [Salinirussus salinus]